MINLESVLAVLTVVAFLAAAVERGVELFRPLLLKIIDENIQNAVKVAVAIVLGVALAALIRIDALAMLGITFNPWAGYVAAGVLASAGASPWHALLEWLKSIKREDEYE